MILDSLGTLHDRDSATASKGLGWAVAMLALMAIEWLVLLHVLGFDVPQAEWQAGGGFVEVYFWACTVTLLLQIAGVALVLRARYRWGGLLQIAACLLHLPKGEGLLGLLGGVKAFRYGRSMPG